MIRNLIFGTSFIERKDPMKWVRLGMHFSDNPSSNHKQISSYNKKRSEKAMEKIKEILKNG
jgi:hypothetical protein